MVNCISGMITGDQFCVKHYMYTTIYLITQKLKIFVLKTQQLGDRLNVGTSIYVWNCIHLFHSYLAYWMGSCSDTPVCSCHSHITQWNDLKKKNQKLIRIYPNNILFIVFGPLFTEPQLHQRGIFYCCNCLSTC